MKRELLYGFSLLVLASCGTSGEESNVAETYGPNDDFKIGRGFDPDSTRGQIRGDCFKNPDSFLSSSWKNARGIKAKLSETRINSHEQLRRELSFSMSTSASSTFYSGSAEYSKYDKFSASENSFTWMFNIDAIVGTETMQMDKISLEDLTPAAADLAAKAKFDNRAKENFYRLCGKQFIRTVVYGGSINDVVEISAKAVDQVRKIKSAFNASGGGSFFSASASAKFSSAVEAASRNSYLKREFSQTGGDIVYSGINHLNKEKVIREFQESLSKESSAVIRVVMADWDTFLSWSPSEIDLERKQYLEDMLRLLWKNESKLDSIETFVHLYESNQIELYPEEVEHLKESYALLKKQNDRVRANGRKCYISSKCASDVDLIVINFPELRYQKTTFYEKTIQSWEFLYPLKNVKFTKLTGKEYWMSDRKIYTFSGEGETLNLLTQISINDCSDINEYTRMSTKYGQILYKKVEFTLPDGDYSNTYVLANQKGSQCFFVGLSQTRPTRSDVNINDGSAAAELFMKIGASIN